MTSKPFLGNVIVSDAHRLDNFIQLGHQEGWVQVRLLRLQVGGLLHMSRAQAQQFARTTREQDNSDCNRSQQVFRQQCLNYTCPAQKTKRCQTIKLPRAFLSYISANLLVMGGSG
eukprot:4738983-Amphidinium_carterae.1